MLSGFFNYENPVWRFIGKFWDVMVVSWLWLLCSIPIVTIGASTTAMYYVTLKLVRDEDGYTVSSFFKSFKENFKQATMIWLILLAVGVVLTADLMFMLQIQMENQLIRNLFLSVFLAVIVVYVFVCLYVFPYLARFYNTVKGTLLNAMFLSLRHVLCTIGMIVIDLLIVVCSFFLPVLLLFGLGIFAFANSYILAGVFQKYMPKEQAEAGALRPILEDEAEGEEK